MANPSPSAIYLVDFKLLTATSFGCAKIVPDYWRRAGFCVSRYRLPASRRRGPSSAQVIVQRKDANLGHQTMIAPSCIIMLIAYVLRTCWGRRTKRQVCFTCV